MKPQATHMKYGVMIGLVCIVVSLIIYYTENTFASWANLPSYVIVLIGLILNAKEFSKVNNQQVSFGQIFSSGFKASAIFTLIMLAWALISNQLYPEIMEGALEQARLSMQEQNMSDADIDKAIDMTEKYQTLFLVMGTVFGMMILGLICSLIAAAVTRKRSASPQL